MNIANASFITGTAYAGKSTLVKRLAEKSSEPALITGAAKRMI